MPEQERATRMVRPLRGGQITIPAEFRKRLGISEETVLQITLVDGELHIRPMRVTERDVGSPWLKDLYDLFAPVREAAAAYSEDEIDEAIDQAIAASRADKAKRGTRYR